MHESCALPFVHSRPHSPALAARPGWTATTHLLFDYRDEQNYQFAGLQVSSGRWVIGAIANGTETILASATNSPPQANTWYQLDLVIARAGDQDWVTLYAGGVERITWTRSSGQALTGGRIGVMTRRGAACFQELEQWDVGRVTKSYTVPMGATTAAKGASCPKRVLNEAVSKDCAAPGRCVILRPRRLYFDIAQDKDTMAQRPKLRRSLLYVPGDKETMLAKAASRGADGLILNLEDAVAPANKDAAREIVARSLTTLHFSGVEVIVRINPLEAATGYRDLLAVAPAGPDAILLPKVNSVETVRFVAWALARLEAMAGLPAGRIRIMCMIESAAGVAVAAQIAACEPRMAALIFGANDLAEDLDCAPTPGQGVLLHAACQVVLAARAGGVDAIDTPHMNIHDPEGLARSAALARDLGFTGKSAIHPNQVAIINGAFAPTPEQVAWAKRVLALVPGGNETALGAALLDGQLIEAPHLARAKRILAASTTYVPDSRL